jgi:gliding motility-associated-like protein
MNLSFTIWLFCFLFPICAISQGDEPSNVRITAIGQHQTINCTSDSVQIGIEIENWIPGFSYLWSNGSSDSILLVKPEATETYTVTIINSSLNFNNVESIEVKVFNSAIRVSSSDIEIDKFTCAGEDIELSISKTGGYAPFSYAWSNGSTSSNPVVNPVSSETYAVSITDLCGTQVTTEVSVVFADHDPLSISNIDIAFTCDEEELSLSPDLKRVKGGVGYGYRFSFDQWASENTPLKTTPIEGLNIPFTITDACGIQHYESEFNLVKNEIVLPTCEDQLVCEGSEVDVTSLNDGLYYWRDGTMHVSFSEEIKKEETYELQFLDQCGDMHPIKKHIKTKDLNANFSFDLYQFDGKAQLAPVDPEIEGDIAWFVNGAEISHESNPNIDLPAGVENEVELVVTDEEGCSSRSTRTIVLRDGMDVPTAFSPNGDGLNDYFSVRFEEELKTFNIKIFDRWGQLIYHSNDQYFRWYGLHDEESQTLSSFAYILKATTISEKQLEKRGTISAFTVE